MKKLDSLLTDLRPPMTLIHYNFLLFFIIIVVTLVERRFLINLYYVEFLVYRIRIINNMVFPKRSISFLPTTI